MSRRKFKIKATTTGIVKNTGRGEIWNIKEPMPRTAPTATNKKHNP